ncbi:MAG: hypothetical protein PF450_11230, partial [Bacteroidales bacterium]|nr:hypothetical protein [Bacteroidales bacterium]
MNRLKPIEITGTYLGIGFLIGLIISSLINIIVIESIGGQVTFTDIALAHSSYSLLFFIDTFALIGAFIGLLLARSRNRLTTKISNVTEDESVKSEYIKTVIHNLTIGNLNAKIKDELLTPEMTERLKAMQSRLKENLEAEKAARKADQQRNWTSHGLAEFGDLLR